jgi:hypothetical protein
MSDLAYTLVCDGSSDVMLMSALNWLLEQHSRRTFRGRWADLRRLRDPPSDLTGKISVALDLFPCDLLFVHRDAERAPSQTRVDEIEAALPTPLGDTKGVVPVIPVRMQEAWFLFHEAAIREAAGNPNGDETLDLPPLRTVERIPSPKRALESLLRDASGLRGARLTRMRLGPAKHRLSSLIEDYAALRALPSFSALESDVKRVVRQLGWN